MKITNPEDLKIGSAYTVCCHLDLEVIDSENKLEQIKKDFFEDHFEAWDSAIEAYIDISKRWPDGSKEKDECLDLIKKNWTEYLSFCNKNQDKK